MCETALPFSSSQPTLARPRTEEEEEEEEAELLAELEALEEDDFLLPLSSPPVHTPLPPPTAPVIHPQSAPSDPSRGPHHEPGGTLIDGARGTAGVSNIKEEGGASREGGAVQGNTVLALIWTYLTPKMEDIEEYEYRELLRLMEA